MLLTKNTLVTDVFFVVDLGKQAFTKNASVTAGLNRWILRSRPNYISFLGQGLPNNSSFSLVFYRILRIRRNFGPKTRKFVSLRLPNLSKKFVSLRFGCQKSSIRLGLFRCIDQTRPFTNYDKKLASSTKYLHT